MRFALLLFISSAIAQAPYSTLSPKVTAEGEHVWTFVMQWNPKKLARTKVDPETWVTEAISRHLADQKLCPNGWEILKREEVMKHLMIEGRCRLSSPVAAERAVH